MEHGAAVGVVRAVVVGLDRRHGVVFTDALLELVLEVLQQTQRTSLALIFGRLRSTVGYVVLVW